MIRKKIRLQKLQKILRRRTRKRNEDDKWDLFAEHNNKHSVSYKVLTYIKLHKTSI